MSTHDAATALRRFGLGARPGEIARIAGDPRGFVVASIAQPNAAILNDPGLEPSNVTLTSTQIAGQQQKLARDMQRADAIDVAQRRAQASGELQMTRPQGRESTASPGAMADARMAAEGATLAKKPRNAAAVIRREAFQDEAAARLERQAGLDQTLPERLVMFWSNHFCVSATKGNVRGLAGAFERETIRPHVLGHYAAMLKAVEQHPAMLIYLDNQLSFGPTSQAGRNQKIQFLHKSAPVSKLVERGVSVP